MAEVMNSLFGVTPEALMAQREAALAQQATNFAQLSPMQAAQAGFYTAGNRLAGVAGGLMGAQDPEMAKAAALQGILKGADTTSPEGLATLAKTLSAQGFGAQAMQVMDQARQARLQTAQTQKAEMSVAQEEALRKELAALGPNATEADIMKAVTKYGSADKVLATLQSSADKAATRQQQFDLQQERIKSQIQMAADRGATQKEIAQMQIEGRNQLAQLAASLKGPSAAVLKAQEKADKVAEGQAGLSDTVEVAKTLVNDIASKGGMTSTSQGPLANLVTSLGSGTIGQIGGRLVGTEVQAKRDELKSIRLQLLNSIKEATGMSSQQLNSNMELKTWLDSLGADNMTKEANLAILNNISNRYLKGAVKAPEANAGNDPLGIRKQK
jgi:hypothetical protein